MPLAVKSAGLDMTCHLGAGGPPSPNFWARAVGRKVATIASACAAGAWPVAARGSAAARGPRRVPQGSLSPAVPPSPSLAGRNTREHTPMPQPAWVKGRLQTEPFLSRLFYGLIIKRSSTYMTAVMIVATTVGARSLISTRTRIAPSTCSAALTYFLYYLLLFAHMLCASRWAVPPRRHRVRLHDGRRVEHDQQGGAPRARCATTAQALRLSRDRRGGVGSRVYVNVCVSLCVCLRRALRNCGRTSRTTTPRRSEWQRAAYIYFASSPGELARGDSHTRGKVARNVCLRPDRSESSLAPHPLVSLARTSTRRRAAGAAATCLWAPRYSSELPTCFLFMLSGTSGTQCPKALRALLTTN